MLAAGGVIDDSARVPLNSSSQVFLQGWQAHLESCSVAEAAYGLLTEQLLGQKTLKGSLEGETEKPMSPRGTQGPVLNGPACCLSSAGEEIGTGSALKILIIILLIFIMITIIAFVEHLRCASQFCKRVHYFIDSFQRSSAGEKQNKNNCDCSYFTQEITEARELTDFTLATR